MRFGSGSSGYGEKCEDPKNTADGLGNEPGTAIELEVALIERPLGFGSVQMCTAAHVVRAEESEMPGWRGYAASFDDFALKRDDHIPLRYHPR